MNPELFFSFARERVKANRCVGSPHVCVQHFPYFRRERESLCSLSCVCEHMEAAQRQEMQWQRQQQQQQRERQRRRHACERARECMHMHAAMLLPLSVCCRCALCAPRLCASVCLCRRRRGVVVVASHFQRANGVAFTNSSNQIQLKREAVNMF